MSEFMLEQPGTTPATPRSKRGERAAKPATLGECEPGRVVTLRLVVSASGGDRLTFCRAIGPDGRESEPSHLPADWPIAEGER